MRKADAWIIYSCVLLLPIILFGFFAFVVYPSADDVSDMARLHNYGASNIFDVFANMHRSAFVLNMSGTFAHYILRAASPAYFSLWLNRLVLFLNYWLYVYAVYRFISELAKYFLDMEKKKVTAVAVTIVFLSVNALYSPAQSFFWYSGAVNYTLVFSCVLLLLAQIMAFFWGEEMRRGKLVRRHIVSALLIFLVMGSQTAGGVLLLGILFFICFFHTAAAVKKFIYYYFVSAAGLLLLNVLNSFGRREIIADRMGAVSAAVNAAATAPVDFLRWHHGVSLLLLVIFAPVLVAGIRRGKYFAHPILAGGVAGVLFVAMYVPAFFGLGMRGPERVVDFYRNVSYLILWVWYVNCVGFLVTKKYIPESFSKHKYLIAVGVGLLFVSFGAGHLRVLADGSFARGAAQIRDGAISQYRRVMDSRALIFASETANRVELARFPHARLVVFDRDVMELTADAGHWRSVSLGWLHGKESIRAVEDLGGRIFRVVASPTEVPQPGTGHRRVVGDPAYITEIIPIRDNLFDIIGVLPVGADGAPLAHENVFLTVSRDEGTLFFPVYPLALDVPDRSLRQNARQNKFTVSINIFDKVSCQPGIVYKTERSVEP